MKHKKEELIITLIKSDFLGYDFPRGWGNGYVDVPSWHPLFGMTYNDVYETEYGGYIDVCGGLTFSQNMNKKEDGTYTHTRFGFDTAHYHNDEKDDVYYVEQEAVKLRDQLWEIYITSIGGENGKS